MSITDGVVLRNYEDAPMTPPPESVGVALSNYDDAPKAPPPDPVWSRHAHDRHSQGFAVIPCRPRTKIARARGLFSNQRKWEPSRIDRHSRSNPGDNIGIRLDRYSRLHLVVFDIDGDPGWAGVEDLFDHNIPPTYNVSTVKGHHLYYATRHNYKSRNRLFPDLDVKASGCVLGAGSIHPSGARYVANDLEVTHLPLSVEERLVEMGLRRVGHPERSEIGKSAQRGKAMVLAPEGTRLVDPDSPKSPPESNPVYYVQKPLLPIQVLT